jgi:hypothetical protein
MGPGVSLQVQPSYCVINYFKLNRNKAIDHLLPSRIATGNSAKRGFSPRCKIVVVLLGDFGDPFDDLIQVCMI